MIIKITDITYINREGKSIIKIFSDKGVFYDSSFKPYFYIKTKNIEKIKKMGFEIKKEKEGYKIIFESTQKLKEAREILGSSVEKYEFDIPFVKRYLTDKNLSIPCFCKIEADGDQIKKIEFEKPAIPKILAFDIETCTEKNKMHSPKNSQTIMISFSGKEKEVWTTKEGINGTRYFETEKEMIEKAAEKIKESKEEVIATYNGEAFDIPFLEERAKILGAHFLDLDKKKGRTIEVNIIGKQHLDVFHMIKLLNRFNVTNIIKFDLESVVEKTLGIKKEKIDYREINSAWRKGDKKRIERIAEYCKEDSDTTKKIAEKYIGLIMEIADLVKREVNDVAKASSASLIEALILKESKKYNILVPRLPTEEEYLQRMKHSYIGGFVRSPLPGLHENIAVLDFSSLHPTLIISHNISPETLDCGHDECKKNMAPTKHYFCTKKKGFIPAVIENLFYTRMKYKKKMKELKGTKEYEKYYDKSWAYKIFLNSFYGYLGYPRSRFYCRECAAAVTGWSKKYIEEVGKEAEKEGYKILYGDTDSEFLIMPKNKTKKDVLEFVKKINSKLPGVMNLELENIYKRGIFVTKDTGETAKKRYALIDEKGELKIVGLEYVRRDWAKIARDTQKKVIEAVLKDGSPEKALQIIRKTIDYLKKGKAKKEELIIMTRLIKDIKKYAAKGPHVEAAIKAQKRGKTINQGDVIEYIITKTGKSISDKAELAEFVKEGDYDIDYYIEHQIIAAVYKIMRELGYSKTDLIKGGKQSNLLSFG